MQWIKLLPALALLTGAASAAQPSSEIRLDYAYYSPASLVIKKLGWLEEEFKGTTVKWILSQGSNRALEYLNAGALDVGSTASLSAVLARANGKPIKSVYIYSQAEWTALVVPKDSKIASLRDLKGKRVAATKGTDPYLFLLRSLRTVGLTKEDIELVHLQHPDGRAALEAGKVDAWGRREDGCAAHRGVRGARHRDLHPLRVSAPGGGLSFRRAGLPAAAAPAQRAAARRSSLRAFRRGHGEHDRAASAARLIIL